MKIEKILTANQSDVYEKDDKYIYLFLNENHYDFIDNDTVDADSIGASCNKILIHYDDGRRESIRVQMDSTKGVFDEVPKNRLTGDTNQVMKYTIVGE